MAHRERLIARFTQRRYRLGAETADDNVRGALVRAGIDPARVIMVECFDPTHDEQRETCAALLPFVTPGVTEWAQEAILAPLNRGVRRGGAQRLTACRARVSPPETNFAQVPL